jgi:hypothetical protein
MYKSIFTILSCITIASATILPAQAQSSATEGTDFYVTFPNESGSYDNLSQISYVVTETCRITAQYGDGTYLDNDTTYTPGVYLRHLDAAKSHITDTESGASDRMLHITATKNIGVYAYGMHHASTDATIVLPVAAWGTDYAVISNTRDYKFSYIAVIAPIAGTVFTIRDASGAAVVTDQATDVDNPVYNYVVSGPSILDLTGYTVESNHPVAVFSSVPYGKGVHSGGIRSYNYEQLYPTNTAGKNFFLWNLSMKNLFISGEASDKVVILALEDATTVIKKEGATTTPIFLNRHDTISFLLDTAVHRNSSTAPVMLTSDQPIIVNRILGYASSIIWETPLERRITRAVVAFHSEAGFGRFRRCQLNIMIPAGSQQDMFVRETFDGVVTDHTLTFHTNTSNPDYVIGTWQHDDDIYDRDAMIELINPSGFIAYMTGYENEHGAYLLSVGFVETYFTVATKAQPFADTHYSATREATHTFTAADTITVKRTLERPFDSFRWLIHGEACTSVTENTYTRNTLAFPASLFHCGKDSIVMSVRYKDAAADSVYTSYVWIDNSVDAASDITVTGDMNIIYQGPATTLTASSATVTTPTFRWYDSQSATANLLHTGASYSPTLSTTTTYYVSVSNDKVCENKPGERKEVTVTVTYLIPVNPHLRTRVTPSAGAVDVGVGWW